MPAFQEFSRHAAESEERYKSAGLALPSREFDLTFTAFVHKTAASTMLARSPRLPATCRVGLAPLSSPSRGAPFTRPRTSVRTRAWSVLMFLGVEKQMEAKDDGSAPHGGAVPTRQEEGAVAQLRRDVDSLKER